MYPSREALDTIAQVLTHISESTTLRHPSRLFFHMAHSTRTKGFLWHTRAPQVSLIMGFLVVVLATSGCRTPEHGTGGSHAARPDSSLQSRLNSMNLMQKVSSLFMVPVPDRARLSDAGVRERLQRDVISFGAGGVVVMSGTGLDTAAMLAWLQAEQQDLGRLPLLTALDAEWGTGMRFPDMPVYPRAMGLAASRDARLAREVGFSTARAARAAGINVVFAPIADVNTEILNPVIGTRAFSDHPDSVAVWASAFSRGIQEAGVMAVGKHFPGHGGTTADSHVALPKATLRNLDLVPFRQVIADSVGGLMSAHVLYDEGGPATLSPALMSTLLRDSLHYGGLLFSDALNMAGVTLEGSPGEVAVRAVQAGIDVLLMSPDAEEARAAIVNAVRRGDIEEARIDQAVLRQLAARASHMVGTDLGEVTTIGEREWEFSVYAARRALTLLKRQDDILPLVRPGERVVIVETNFRRASGGVSTGNTSTAEQLRSAMAQFMPGSVEVIGIPPRSWTVGLRRAARSIQSAGTVLWIDANGTTPVAGWDTAGFSAALTDLNDRVVALPLASPWSVRNLDPATGTVLMAYDVLPPTIEALARALTGRAGVTGRLPVHVSDDYPAGAGMDMPAVAPSAGPPEEVGMTHASLRMMDTVIHTAIADSAFPAATLLVGRGNTLVKRAAFGHPTYDGERAVSTRDIFDLASLTKVIATTTMVMLMVEDGQLELDRPVADYLPAFGQENKGMITIRDLLSHTGGLIPFRAFYADGVRSAAEVRRRILTDSLAYAPGTDTRYSDFGPITLAWVMESITGKPFKDLVQERVFGPLGMVDTGFREAKRQRDNRVIPTEVDNYFRQRTLLGEVHDENAWLLGGTAGHAGLFSTVEDLGIFAAMLVNEGRVGDTRFLKPETIELFTTAVQPGGPSTRALGWDTRSRIGYSSAGAHFGPRSFGHTGFTGTSFWIDPDQELYVILLTNRVFPTRNNRGHVPVRPAMANGAFNALDDLPEDRAVLRRE